MRLFILAFFAVSLALAASVRSHAQEAPAPEEGAPTPSLLPRSEPGFRARPEAGAFAELCPTIRMENRGDFDFGPMETRLLCGDSTQDNVGTPWATIPPNQAAYFLKGFLQARAHHQPEFIQDGEILFVRPGGQSKLSKFTITGGPSTWVPPTRRLVIGQPLTPPLLNDLQGWALSQIKDEGYACATAESRADPLTGEAVVELRPGELRIISGIEDTGDTGLRPGVLDRYNAFKVGQVYRERLISLTRRRTQEDGFLQTLLLSARCEPLPTSPGQPATVTIVRDVNLGPSRTVRVGAGYSNDRGARLRVILRQNRIGESASSAEARLNLSYREPNVNSQILNSRYRWYYSTSEARSFLEPNVTYEHTAESARDFENVAPGLFHGWNHEFTDGQLEVRVGPSYQAQRIFRGEGSDTSLALLEVNTEWISHDFEFFNTSPRKGEFVRGAFLATQRSWASPVTAQRLEISGEKLWDIGRYDPPLLILGLRYSLSSVFSPEDGDLQSRLPLRFLTFLGGERDLRGFESRSLPRSGLGALSGATTGFEARLHKVLFRRADVFGFLDAGLLGGKSFALEKPILMSPGLGVRWESPVGTLRAYVAQRFALEEPAGSQGYDRNFRFGFTFGEEF